MSFVEQEDIFKVAENFIQALIPAVSPHKRIKDNKVFRLTHKEAARYYGSDRPDLRFGCRFEDFTQDFAKSNFSVFRGVVDAGGVVRAFKLSGVSMSRSEIDAITEVAVKTGAKGLAYIIYDAEGAKSPILKFFSSAETRVLEEKLQPKA